MKKFLYHNWLIAILLPVIPFLVGFYLKTGVDHINSESEQLGYIKKVSSHYKKRLTLGLDTYGRDVTPFWMASLDTKTGKYPEDDSRPSHIPQRAYLDRFVDAPRGSNLYWDMPSIVTAYSLSEMTGKAWYREKAEAYIRAFLARSVANNGIFLWGNHYYYDAFKDSTMKFGSQPVPVDMENEKGDLHEIRPILPAWEVFWKVSPEATELEIRTSTNAHLADKVSGEFNRHADGERQHAFLEAGGSLVHSLGWLYSKTSDIELLEQADKIVNYSFSKAEPSTGLIPNDPTSSRWDNFTTTTEIGLWAGCLLNAAKMAEEPYKQKWIAMADKAMSAWLKYGFDTKKRQYYGMLNVSDGEPIFRDSGDDYPYKPGNYSDIWEPLFPTHNYPMTFAESCLRLYEITKNDLYKQAIFNWVDIIEKELPARDGEGAYAEHYGRVIDFLLSCDEKLDDKKFKEIAINVANEAVTVLFSNDMFRSHPGENRYDAVDGVGILSLSLIWLETGEKPDMMGMYY